MAWGSPCLQVFGKEGGTVPDDRSSRITNSQTSSSKTMNIYYQNVHDLRTKVEDFYESILSENYDIVAITETWLTDSLYNAHSEEVVI